MKTQLQLLIAVTAVCISIAGAKEIPVVKGSYIGWKSIRNMTMDDGKKYPSYEIHKMSIKDGVVTISTATRTIMNREVWSSATGPFKTIKGSFYYKEDKLMIKLQVKQADYLRKPDVGWPEENHEVTIIGHTKISFNGVNYTLLGRNAG